MLTYRKIPIKDVREISEKCLIATYDNQEMLLPTSQVIVVDQAYWVAEWLVYDRIPWIDPEEFDVMLLEEPLEIN